MLHKCASTLSVLQITYWFPWASKHYETSNPFPWMEMIGMQGKTNFFERRVGEYQKAGVATENNRAFSTDEDF